MREPINLNSSRVLLQRWARSPSTSQRVALRSRIILLLGDGHSARRVAHLLGISRNTVDLWRTRFNEEGPPALLRDKPGRGRKPKSRDERSVRAMESQQD